MTKLDTLKVETTSLLSHDIFLFNKTRNSYTYFPDYLKKLFNEYNQLLDNEKFWKAFCAIHYSNNPEEALGYNTFRKMIEDFSDKIIDCVNAYYLGKVSSAYQYLCDGLNNNINFNVSSLFEAGLRETEIGDLVAYRIRTRKDEIDYSFERKQMFHIPFELRHSIKTQRFSIPGYPSLYLGDSSYVCWKELNEPKINNVYVSRFTNSQTIRIIEILSKTEITKRLSGILVDEEYSRELFRFLLFFPLNIASSVKTKDRNATFKCEYIVPQLFLQYITEHKESVDGVKYYSTRVDETSLENVGFNNYVFPTKTNQQIGYCDKLRDKFLLTEPILWEYEGINNGNVTFLDEEPKNGITLELNKGRRVLYDNTTFRAIEKTLNYDSMTLSKVI